MSKNISTFLLLAALGVSTGLVHAQHNSNSLLPTVFTSLETAMQYPSNVYHLDLSYQGLTQFPEEILQMENLRVLNLSGNYISELPQNLSKIHHMEELYLNNNLFAVFPQPVFQLNKLRVLEML